MCFNHHHSLKRLHLRPISSLQLCPDRSSSVWLIAPWTVQPSPSPCTRTFFTKATVTFCGQLKKKKKHLQDGNATLNWLWGFIVKSTRRKKPQHPVSSLLWVASDVYESWVKFIDQSYKELGQNLKVSSASTENWKTKPWITL